MLSMKTEKTSWDLKDLETILKVLFINVQFYEITSFSFKSGGPIIKNLSLIVSTLMVCLLGRTRRTTVKR